jgi:hypothetical protein
MVALGTTHVRGTRDRSIHPFSRTARSSRSRGSSRGSKEAALKLSLPAVGKDDGRPQGCRFYRVPRAIKAFAPERPARCDCDACLPSVRDSDLQSAARTTGLAARAGPTVASAGLRPPPHFGSALPTGRRRGWTF